jgi:hypothetical protein
VKTGDRDREAGRGQGPVGDNVIRLPTDWLGPREELVPVAPPRRPTGRAESEEEVTPPSAETFWSEDAGSLHDAVQAPRAPVDMSDPPPAGPPARSASHQRRAGVNGGRLARPRLGRPAVAAGILILALLVLGAFISVQPGHVAARAPRQAAAITPSTSSGSASASAGVLTRARLLTRQRGHADSARRGRARKAIGRARHSARQFAAQRGRHPHRTILHPDWAGARSASPAPPSTPAVPATSAVSDGATASTAETSSVPAANSSSAGPYVPPAHPVASSARSSGGSATSSGQPAFGSGGALGPGTSPDS